MCSYSISVLPFTSEFRCSTLDIKSIWELSFHKIANCMPIQIRYMTPKHVDYLDMILRSLTDPEDIPV